MDQSVSSDQPFDERRKQKPQQAFLKSLPQNAEESSQTTETTAAATISTLPSFSESKATQRRRYIQNILAGDATQSDSKLAGLRKEWENISPRRLFQQLDTNAEADHAEEEEEGDAALSSNDAEPSIGASLPQEQMNDLVIAHSESSELSAETEHLRYLREKVDRQVQSMSKLLLEAPSDRPQGNKQGGSARPQRHNQERSKDAAVQQFQAVSDQVVADFLDPPNKPARIQKRRKRERAASLHLTEDASLQLNEARHEIEELQRQLTDYEQANSLSQGNGDPQVMLLHQQRSKLQRRIRELLHDAAELRQERNSFQMQCLEQSRRIHSLEDSFRQLEEEKKDSEKGLYRYISALQDKSTQLLEELQETRRMLQHESQCRIEASMEAKHRIATLETDRRRLERVVSRNAETPDLVRSKEAIKTAAEDQSMIPDQLVISNMEAIAGNDRIQKSKSEVQLRRAKIEAIRRKRSDEEKTSPQNKGNQTPTFRNHAPSPVSMHAYSPRSSPQKSARSPMSFDGDRTDGPPGMQLFLQRIETAMEEGATSFANQTSAFHLQQELLDLKHENVELKLLVQEAEENAAVLQSTARGTVARFQEATDREENLTKQLNEQRAAAELAKTQLKKQEIVLKEHKQKLEDLNAQLAGSQKEYLELKEHAKKFEGLEQGHSTLQGIIESHKAQNRAMTSQIDSLEMTVVDLEMANGSLKDHIVVLEGDLKKQEGLVAKLSGDLSASSGREASTRKELETAVRETNALQSKIQGISVELEESQKNVKQLESTVSTAEENQLEMTKKLEASETDLTRTKQESSSLAEELETIQQAMKNLRTEKGAQALALKHAEQVQNELASRLAASELALKEQARTSILQDEEVSRLVEKCLGIKSETSTLTTDDGSPPPTPATPRTQQRQQHESNLKLEFAETSERRGVLERQLRDLHSQFQSLRQGDESSANQTAGLGKNLHLRSLDSAIGRLRAECEQLASKNTHLQDQNYAMKQLVSDSEKLRQELEKIISERETELETLQEANLLVGAEATALQIDRKQLAAENEIYASIQQELEARLADAARLIDSSLPRIKELESQVEDLNKEVTGRDIVLNGVGKENTELTEQVKALNDAVEFWVKKCKDLEPVAEARREESKSQDSLVTRVTEHLQRLADIKAEVMKQLFRTAGSVDYKSSEEVMSNKASGDVLADIQDLHYVLDTVRQFIVASREATMHLDRTIESLRDEKSLLNTRNAALERIVEEQRSQSNEFEKLLSTMRVVPSHGSLESHSVAVQSRGTQTQADDEDDDFASEQDLQAMTDDGTSRSMSPLSEINSNDDMTNSPSWSELSEVDSKNDSMKYFPPSDDISDLSQTSTLEPMASFVWKESSEDNNQNTQAYSISVQPPSTQLENIAAAESFQELRTPRVSNSAHPDRLNRQQQPPEYNITLGVLSPSPTTTANLAEPSPIDRYAIEQSSEFAKDRTKHSFDFA